MSKSRDNTLDLLATPDELWDKLQRREDRSRSACGGPTRGGPSSATSSRCTQFLSTPEEVARVDRECRTAGIGCVDCKKILHASLLAMLDPIREPRGGPLPRAGPGEGRSCRTAAARARAEAQETMAIVRERCGLNADRRSLVDQRHRAVVHELDLHVRAEDARPRPCAPPSWRRRESVRRARSPARARARR